MTKNYQCYEVHFHEVDDIFCIDRVYTMKPNKEKFLDENLNSKLKARDYKFQDMGELKEYISEIEGRDADEIIFLYKEKILKDENNNKNGFYRTIDFIKHASLEEKSKILQLLVIIISNLIYIKIGHIYNWGIGTLFFGLFAVFFISLCSGGLIGFLLLDEDENENFITGIKLASKSLIIPILIWFIKFLMLSPLK